MSTTSRVIAGRYRLDDQLGRGGMGIVWRAHDTTLGRDVAIKEVLLPPDLDDDARSALFSRTLREARAIARLSHPAVVTVFDVVTVENRPWIVMELVPARSLAELLKQDGPLPPVRAAEIGLRLLDALAVAHAAGIVHRDVKPGNVLIDGDGRAVLTDFGIARLEGDPAMTTSGLLVGSPSYIAPERARGLAVGPQSDLWGLGATLYTAVEGRPPYQRDSPLATLAAVITDDPDAGGHAGALAPVIAGLLHRDPGQRSDLATARRGLAEVARAATGGPTAMTGTAHAGGKDDGEAQTVVSPVVRATAPPVVATTPAPQPPPPDAATAPPVEPATTAPPSVAADPHARRRWLVTAVLLVAGALLAGAGWFLLDGPGGDQDTRTSAGSSATVRPSHSATAPPPSAKAPSATAPGTPATASVPTGYRLHRDTTGFSVAIPAGWRVVRDGRFTYFRDPDSPRYLLIDQSSSPRPDAAADWRDQESYRKPKLQDYRRIRIAPIDYRGYVTAADWEFTYTRPDIGPVRILNRGFVTGPRHAYGMYWLTPADQWDAGQPMFDVFAATFEPAD